MSFGANGVYEFLPREPDWPQVRIVDIARQGCKLVMVGSMYPADNLPFVNIGQSYFIAACTLEGLPCYTEIIREERIFRKILVASDTRLYLIGAVTPENFQLQTQVRQYDG